MAATIRDEQGNLIQLTDEQGNPVKLTDEHGNPVHITGTATTRQHPTLSNIISSDPVPGTGLFSSTAKSEDEMKGTHDIRQTGQYCGVAGDQGARKEEQDEISSTSSSDSSECDEQGGIRKKKGLKQKIKEKITGGKHKEEHGHTVEVQNTTTGPAGEHYQEHEKKSVIEKIKGKLSGHHQ